MTQHENEHKLTIADKFAGFISKNKIILWVVLALLLLLTIVFAVVDTRNKDRNDMYSDIAVEIQGYYQEWISAPEEDKEAAEIIFLDKIAEITDTEKTNILVERVLFLRGQFYLQKEDWESAYTDFNQVAVDSPDSYLASVCLYNAASAKENAGDIQAALDILSNLSVNYRSNSPIIPEALFNLGRLNEILDKKIDALSSYEDLTTSYSSSNWTNLAKTRIISLKASGVSQ